MKNVQEKPGIPEETYSEDKNGELNLHIGKIWSIRDHLPCICMKLLTRQQQESTEKWKMVKVRSILQ